MTLASPCTGVCKLDDATGWCLGCGRSGDEIMDWRSQPDAWRSKIWDLIPNRLTSLGVTARRLPWTTQDIRSFVINSLVGGRGTWVVGVLGAVAEFSTAPDQSLHVTQKGNEIIARTSNAAPRMLINEDIRALTFESAEMLGEPRIVLAAKRERGVWPKRTVLRTLAPMLRHFWWATTENSLILVWPEKKQGSACASRMARQLKL
ncbi:MAG: DUF1289 domain-containing protein [Marinovum sp.]|nr:DUF1289 domain-containing protein [Marinovum sp.]